MGMLLHSLSHYGLAYNINMIYFKFLSSSNKCGLIPDPISALGLLLLVIILKKSCANQRKLEFLNAKNAFEACLAEGNPGLKKLSEDTARWGTPG